jgi:hypothetical protein
MKIVKNEKLIKRNGKIGQWTSIGALVVLGAGMYISFTRPELFVYSVGALLLGFTMTQIGMYMGNRWGRSPRPDEKLDAGLKGLPGDYTLYHYATPVAHLLLGPAGLWVLMPYHQRGKMTFQKNRWRNSGGGFFQGYMRIFGQEGLGRPELEIETEIRTLKKFLAGGMEESEIPEIRAAMVFTSDDVEIEVNDSPVPAVKLKQLKDFMRQKAKEKPIGSLKLESIKSLFSDQQP